MNDTPGIVLSKRDGITRIFRGGEIVWQIDYHGEPLEFKQVSDDPPYYMPSIDIDPTEPGNPFHFGASIEALTANDIVAIIDYHKQQQFRKRSIFARAARAW